MADLTDVQKIRQRNFKELIKFYGSGKEAALALDMSEQLVSNYVTGTKGMGEKLANRIEETAQLYKYDLSSAEFDPNSISNVATGPDLKGQGVPLISWVTAGDWEVACDTYEPGEADEYFYTNKNHSERAYCLRVVGESMWNAYKRPSYFDGDIIIVDPDLAGAAGNTSPVIARLLDESLPMSRRVTFKQLVIEGSQRFLAPINKDFKPLYDDFEVIGLVIGGIY